MKYRGIAAALLAVAISFAPAAGGAEAKKPAGETAQRTHDMRKVLRRGGRLPPFAFIKMCVKTPSVCRNSPGRLAMAGHKVRLNKKLYGQLASVNASVNRKIKPVRDGRLGEWRVNATRGDCEDYVLAKKMQLQRQGWPSRALSIAIVQTRHGSKHAVLVAHTSSGRYVLDNLTQHVVPIGLASYRFVSMQLPQSGKRWSSM